MELDGLKICGKCSAVIVGKQTPYPVPTVTPNMSNEMPLWIPWPLRNAKIYRYTES